MGGAEVIAAWIELLIIILLAELPGTVYCATLLIYALLHIVVLYRQIALLYTIIPLAANLYLAVKKSYS